MIEKVNPMLHPDKIADRIADAIVDLAYNTNDNPKVIKEMIVFNVMSSRNSGKFILISHKNLLKILLIKWILTRKGYNMDNE